MKNEDLEYPNKIQRSRRPKDHSTCLSFVNPVVASEWHPTKNGDLTPEDVSYGSDKSVWWQCSRDSSHEWEAKIYRRSGGNTCPFCAGKKVPPRKCLGVMNPELAKEFHPYRNSRLKAENANILSKSKVWWQCQKDEKHVWKETISARHFYHAACPYCVSSNPLVKKIDHTKSLAALDPERAKLWHPTKNGELTPFHVLCHTQANVWWLCSKDLSHEWEAKVASQKISCPFCTNLKMLYPEIAKEWHIMRNHPLKSAEAHLEMKKKVWWQCGKNTKHIWQASVRARVRDNRCPECVLDKIG